MQFLALLRRITESFSPEAFSPLMEPEADRVRTLYSEGIIRQAWSRGDVPGAGLLLEVADEKAAREIVSTLPFFAAGMLELTSLVPLLPYRGFGPRG